MTQLLRLNLTVLPASTGPLTTLEVVEVVVVEGGGGVMMVSSSPPQVTHWSLDRL